MSNPKRFEDWEKVDCNECGRYWDSSCDGVKCDTNSDKPSTGSTKPCNSFLATRSVVIPAKLEALQERVERLEGQTVLLLVMVILEFILCLLGG